MRDIRARQGGGPPRYHPHLHGGQTMSIFADIRYALRLVRHDWRFSLILIATLATGIAASGAIFNVVNASLLRPLPIPDEARVYRLRDYTQNPGGQRVLRSN